VNVVAVYLSRRSWETGEPPEADLIWSTVPRTRRSRPAPLAPSTAGAPVATSGDGVIPAPAKGDDA
jgi:hypothetical protein